MLEMMAAKETDEANTPKKRPLEHDRDEWEDSRDNSLSPSQARTRSRREPEASSPNNRTDYRSYNHGYSFPQSQSMDTVSPASYPKHVIVPSPPDTDERRQFRVTEAAPSAYQESYTGDTQPTNPDEKVVTPTHNHEPMPMAPHHNTYDGQYSRQGHFYPSDPYGRPYGGHPHTPPSYALPPPPNQGVQPLPHGPGGVQLRHKKWACDYCNVATFSSFEEAVNHEQNCPRRQNQYNRAGAGSSGTHHLSPHMYPPPPPPPPHQQHQYAQHHHQHHNQPYHHQPHQHHLSHPHQQGQPYGGLGALYHASQEVQNYGQAWNGPPMPSEHTGYPPLSPRFQDFRMYDQREDAQSKHSNQHNHRLLLAMPSDVDSLSDRQCYVRSEFVEVFAASEKDVAARHSKGAQKLVLGQVGIRCIHCSHLRPKDRAERAVCYPSSISRIYQTVADMQRFHFEQCREIPDHIRKMYKSLKTTRPRGVGSPQTYWVQSAKRLGMVDSDEGIRFANEQKNVST